MLDSGVDSERLREALSSSLCRDWPPESVEEAEPLLDHMAKSPLLPILVSLPEDSELRLTDEAAERLAVGKALLKSRLDEVRGNRASVAAAAHLCGLRKLVVDVFGLETADFFDAVEQIEKHHKYLASRKHLLTHFFPDSSPVQLESLTISFSF